MSTKIRKNVYKDILKSHKIFLWLEKNNNHKNIFILCKICDKISSSERRYNCHKVLVNGKKKNSKKFRLNTNENNFSL